jgi:hypothetical protein
MYALEGGDPRIDVAVRCALSSTSRFLAGTSPLGIVEEVWSLVAAKRLSARVRAATQRDGLGLIQDPVSPVPGDGRHRAQASAPAPELGCQTNRRGGREDLHHARSAARVSRTSSAREG